MLIKALNYQISNARKNLFNEDKYVFTLLLSKIWIDNMMSSWN